uniref:Tyr recombinase domain-containing protein n=1 Tax=Panagrolaimus superbus TaxID=310955 RepID=A0A914YSD2_9BILA
MELAVVTGQRVGDLCEMKWSDIVDGYLYVEQSKTGVKIAIPTTLHVDALGISMKETLDKCKEILGGETIIASTRREPLSSGTVSSPEQPVNTFSVSRLALALAFGVTLTACSSTPPDQRPSDQTAPGTSSRPILSAKEAQNFDAQHYFASLTPGAAAWNPSPITLPAQPEFVVGPAGTQGVTHTTIQAAVDAAIIKRTNKRQYIAVMPGEYQGTVYVPAAPGGITLYGTGEKPIDVKIGLSLDGGMSPADWRHDVNPRGKYMPGKPAWYMYDSCQSKRSDSIGVLCSAVFWSQNNGLQLQNLTIENTLGDSVDAGNHPAVALRTDGDQVQINNVNILGRQNTFFVTNSGVQNRLETNRQPRTLVTNSYIEGGCGYRFWSRRSGVR